MTKLEALKSMLHDRSLVPECHDDYVAFRHLDGHFLLPIHDEDATFYQLVFPNFWSLEDAETRSSALEAAGAVNAATKLVKVFPTRSARGDQMSMGVELRAADPADFGAQLPALLDSIHAARKLFGMHMMLRSLPPALAEVLRRGLPGSDPAAIDGIDATSGPRGDSAGDSAS